MFRKLLVTSFALVVLLAALATPALAGSESGGGYFTFYSEGGKIGNRFVEWIWAPKYFAGGINYSLYFLCTRTDSQGSLVGKNKVTMKSIAFLGTDSNLLLEFKNQKRKLNKFHSSGYLGVNVPDMAAVANDDFVLSSVQFSIKGSADPGDVVTCKAEVNETTASGRVAPKVKPAPTSSMLEAVRELPIQ